MHRGIYSAATGMQSAQYWLDVASHNLANASTTAYKREVAAFDDGLVRQLRANGGRGAAVGSIGAGAIPKGTGTDFSLGLLNPTGNRLDLALKAPNTAFALQTPEGRRYTRDGSFGLDEQRRLTDGQGRLVLDPAGRPITAPNGDVEIDPNGSVRVGDETVGRIGVFEGNFSKAGFGLLDAADARSVEEPGILTGTLESSNVNVIEEMVSMIRLNRAFELAQRSVQGQDASTDRLIQSLQGR